MLEVGAHVEEHHVCVRLVSATLNDAMERSDDPDRAFVTNDAARPCIRETVFEIAQTKVAGYDPQPLGRRLRFRDLHIPEAANER